MSGTPLGILVELDSPGTAALLRLIGLRKEAVWILFGEAGLWFGTAGLWSRSAALWFGTGKLSRLFGF